MNDAVLYYILDTTIQGPPNNSMIMLEALRGGLEALRETWPWFIYVDMCIMYICIYVSMYICISLPITTHAGVSCVALQPFL